MSYEALLEELETLQKAMPAPAAPESDDDEDEDEDDEGQAHAEPDGDEGLPGPGDGDADKRMAKSFRFELDSGEAVEAVDATDLLKSLHDELQSLRSERSQEAQQAQQVETGLSGLLTVVKRQGELIKSLQGQVATLAKSGSGRKSVLGPDAGTPPAAATDLTGPVLLAKAQSAFDQGRISGKELSTLDVLLRYGETPDADLVRRILA